MKIKLVIQLLFIQQSEMIIVNLLVAQFMSLLNLVFFFLFFLKKKKKNWDIDFFQKKTN